MYFVSLLFASCLLGVSSESCAECSENALPQTGDILIQSLKHKATAQVLAPGKEKGKFANLLAKEMQDLVVTKGQTGLSPEEIEHIKTIKDLIMNSIIPSIADGVADSRSELDSLYEAVAECASHLDDALDIAGPLENTTNTNRDLHKDCRKQEDEIQDDKEEACEELEKAQLGVAVPELDFELGIDMSNQEMLTYLRMMNEHFCGRWKEFEEAMENCENLTDTHTTQTDKCQDLQEDFEDAFCSWKAEIEGACKNFDKCWTEAVGRFNERKEAIEALQETRLEEYDAAVKVNCLWDAWKWEEDPCTVDEDKVRECEENLHPNTTNVTLMIPQLPTPPDCNAEAVSVHPCTEEFLEQEYGTLGVSDEIVADMRATCTACPEPVLPTNGSVIDLAQTVRAAATNLMSAAGSMYVKTGGRNGQCDGVLTTPQRSTSSVKVNVMQASSKVEVKLSDGAATHKMILENDVATVGAKSVLFAADQDTMGITISNGMVQYTKSGTPFAQERATFLLGSADVAVCTTGASVDVKFA